jgi:hypothetical protein
MDVISLSTRFHVGKRRQEREREVSLEPARAAMRVLKLSGAHHVHIGPFFILCFLFPFFLAVHLDLAGRGKATVGSSELAVVARAGDEHDVSAGSLACGRQ